MSKFSGLLVFLALAVLFSACDVGLGQMVNTKVPVISMPEEDSEPGSYLTTGDGNGTHRIWLDVQQDFGVGDVWFYVEYNKINLEEGEVNPVTERFKATFDPDKINPKTGQKGLFYHDLDLSNMMDGTIKTWIVAYDIDNNSTTTTDIIYTVKNTPPQIEMTVPLISGDRFDTINFNDPTQTTKINQSSPLMGIATDLYGVKGGYPQIMIWPYNPDSETGNHYTGPFAGDNDPLSNEREWGVWRAMLDDRNNPLKTNGLKAVQFRWPMVKLAKVGEEWVLPDMNNLSFPNSYLETGVYRYKIRVVDLFNKQNVYPYRTNHGLDLEPGEEHPNKFMAVEVISTTGPVFTWGQNFPRYYNHKEDFTVDIEVFSPNNMNSGEVLAKIGILSAHFNNYPIPGDPTVVKVDPIPEDQGREGTLRYKITIPKEIIPNISSDLYFLHVKATDNQDNFAITNRNFIIDVQGPQINFIDPFELEKTSNFVINGSTISLAPGDSMPELTSTVWFRGTTDDDQRVAKMYYALGKKDVLAANRANDPSVNTGWIDSGLNTVCTCIPPNPVAYCNVCGSGPRPDHPGSPLRSSWGGSLSSWNWKFEDVAEFCRLPTEVNTTGNDFLQPHGSNGYSQNLWELPVSFKLVDAADNVSFFDVIVVLDPDADRPFVELRSHNTKEPFDADANITTVGGEVTVSGIARDNEMIFDVMIRVTAQRDEDCFTHISERAGSPIPSVVKTNNMSAAYLDPNNLDSSYRNTYSGFQPVTIIGNKSSIVNWQYILNSDNSLTAAGKLRRVWVEVMAIDSSIYTQTFHKNIRPTQPITRVELVFSSEVPTISEIRIIQNTPTVDFNTSAGLGTAYSFGATVSDFVVLRARIQGKTPISKINVKGENVVSFTDYLGNPNATTTFTDRYTPWRVRISNTEYYLFIPLNTNVPAGDPNSFWPGRFYHSSGNFSLDIQVQDESEPRPYSTQNTLQVKIDNYYPSANYTGNTNVVGEFSLAGRAWDTGGSQISVFGVDKVVVYLSKVSANHQGHGDPVNLETGAVITGTIPSAWLPAGGQKAMIGRITTEPFPYLSNPTVSTIQAEGAIGELSFFPAILNDTPNANGTYTPTVAGIVINYSGNIGPAASPNKYRTDFDSDLLKKEWSVRINDTSIFADGHYYVHYVVFDTAGNATYNRQQIYIANKYPVINKIWLGTDVNSDGSITNFTNAANPGEYYDYSITNFGVRNNRFGLRLDTSGGNGNKNYRVSYVTRSELIIPALTETKTTRSASENFVVGNIYTIVDPNTITANEWINLGVLHKPAGGDYRNITFVAMSAYSGIGTADVYSYEASGTAANTQRSASNITASTGDYRISVLEFNNDTAGAQAFRTTANETARIPDSTKQSDGSIAVNDQKQRFFTVHVWDSISETVKLASAEVIAINVDNIDTMVPRINAAPFGQEYTLKTTDGAHINSYDDRELTAINITNHDGFLIEDQYIKNVVTFGTGENRQRKGYVSYTVPANVSGKVIFTGRAHDNLKIGRMTVRISNSVGDLLTERNIATFNAGTVSPVQTIANMSADTATNTWGFEVVYQNITMEYGHVLDWRFAWDSSSVNNQNGVVVTFRVYDIESGNGNGNITATSNVNVVPYITDVVTQLSSAMNSTPSTFNRSALGWYPVREEEVITVRGFNFFSTGTYAVPNVTINGTALTGRAVGTLAAGSLDEDTSTGTLTYRQKTQVKGTVAAASTSGALLVTAANATGITSYNNNSVNTEAYNREPNFINNNQLTDDRFVYVWDVGYLVNDRLMVSPIMRMRSSNADRKILFTDYRASSGRLHVTTNRSAAAAATNSNANGMVETGYNRYQNTALAIDEYGDWYAGASNISTSGQANYFTLYSRTGSGAAAAFGGSTGFGEAGNNKRRLLNLRNADAENEVNRVRFPKIYARNTAANPANAQGNNTTATRVFISYFDGHNPNNPVFFHYGAIGTNNLNVTQTGNVVSANTAAGADLNDIGGNGAASTAGNASQGQLVAGDYAAHTHKGGLYTAPGGLSNGVPVIAWYDRTNQNLVFSSGNAVPSGTANGNTVQVTNNSAITNANVWQQRAVIVQRYAGSHVDLVVDGGDNIHLAYYDVRNGGLHYAYIPYNTTTARPDTTAIRTAKVDTYLSAGTKIMINIRQETRNSVQQYVPYISYYHGSYSETLHSVRVAWPKHQISSTKLLSGTDANDRFTEDWEVMTVPAGRVPLSDVYISNGVPAANTNWNTNLPAGSDLTYADIHQSILVGYMTDNWYEGAALKYNTITGTSQSWK